MTIPPSLSCFPACARRRWKPSPTKTFLSSGLVQELNPERSQSHAPVAQLLFVLQTAVDRPSRLAGLEQERVLTDRGTAKFDRGLFVVDSPQGLQVSIEHCTDLFEASTVQRMLEHYPVLLESAVADPDRPVAELAILSAGDRARLQRLTESAPAPASLPCAHERFAAQAASTPDAVALSAGAQRLTYAELDLQTATLATRLRELGAGPDVVVAIAAERSIEMVVAVLAVLRAGAAYAAIDPGYPAERVSFMLSDCGARILLTQERLLAGLPDRPPHTICLDGDPAAWPAGERAADAAQPRSRTSPTSSTPPDRPDDARAWPCHTGRWPTCWPGSLPTSGRPWPRAPCSSPP